MYQSYFQLNNKQEKQKENNNKIVQSNSNTLKFILYIYI